MTSILDRYLPWVLVFVLIGISAWQQNLMRSDQNARFDELRTMHSEMLEAVRPIQQQLATHGIVVPLTGGIE